MIRSPSTPLLLACATLLAGCQADPAIPVVSEPLENEGPLLVDARDGRAYPTVFVGDKLWMARDLAYDTLDGTESFCYGDDGANCALHGRLYRWTLATGIEARCSTDICTHMIGDPSPGICPQGWRMPDTSDWNGLMEAAGGKDVAGVALRAATGWSSNDGSDSGGSDLRGFASTPTGFRMRDALSPGESPYFEDGWIALYWSIREHYVWEGWRDAWALSVEQGFDGASLRAVSKRAALAVRCLKDTTPE